MGRKSKASQSRIGNFGQTQRARPGADVITASDSEAEDEDYLPSNHPKDLPIRKDDNGFIFFKDYESDDEISSDSEDDSDLEVRDELEEYQEIRNDADLLKFSAILAEAQKIAVKLEREHDESRPKRPKHYKGNAARTKRFHAQKRRTLAAEGQKFISHFFTATEKTVTPLPHADGSDPDSENNESIVDIDEHLDRIFGGPEDERINSLSESPEPEPEPEFYSVS